MRQTASALSRKEIWTAGITLAALLVVAAYDVFRIGESALRDYLPTFVFLALPGGLALYLCITKKRLPLWAWAFYLIGGFSALRLITYLGHFSY
jgi:hypothetical protein